MKREKVQAIAPEEFEEIKLKKPANYAAGPTAIKVAMDHAIEEMGLSRAMQTLARMNKKNGFDCPGCAWPDPDDKRSVLGEYCENGVKALAEEATLKRVDPAFFEKHSIAGISSWSDYKIGKSGRLTHPMVLKPGENHYKPISWDEAFELIGKKLKKLKSPNEAIFYTSGRSSNEAAFLYGLFCRAYGTNNMPDCSNMCHESSGVALKQTVGIGKGSVVLDDLHKADVVIVIGQNPGTNHPRMLSALEKCKEKGGKIISINPLNEAGLKRFKNPQRVGGIIGGGTYLTDVFLQVKINQDVPLLKAIQKELLSLNKVDQAFIDHTFIEEKTSGFDGLVEDLENYKTEDLLDQSGISTDSFDEALKLLAPARKIIICWAMGLTQHKNGVENIKECVNLLLMKGSIGKDGAGTCPVRGHSNVQGDRTVGIVSKVNPKINKALKEKFGFNAPDKAGYDTVACIQAMYDKKATVFVSLGGNFLSAASDTNFTAEALQNCDLTVSISTKLNRTHVIPGKTSLILPTLGRSEKDEKNGKERKLSVENSMGKVHSTAGKLEPASEHLISEVEIVCRMAKAVIGNESIDWDKYMLDYSLVRQTISEIIDGFEEYEKRISDGNEFYLPNNARKADFSKMKGGKAKFSICELPDHHLDEDEFLMMTIRSHDQFNTTIYGLDDRYRGIYNERRVVLMNQQDMKDLGLQKLDVVNLISVYDKIERSANNFKVVPYNIPRENIATYFPEANSLVPINHFADQSRTPISKSVRVKILIK